MHARTDKVKTVYLPQTKFAGGITMFQSCHEDQLSYHIVFLQVSLKQFSVLVCGERREGGSGGCEMSISLKI